MKTMKEILATPETNYKGSEANKKLIEEQIMERWGDKELKKYSPLHSCRTFKSWLSLGYRVKKGEKALKSVVWIEDRDDDDNIVRKIKKPCFLFLARQVEKITSDDNNE